MDKNSLRKYAKEIRKNLFSKNANSIANSRVQQSSLYKNSKNILIFYPLKYEFNFLELLNDDKDFFLPKVCGEKLQICPYKKEDILIKSDLNICEPCTNPINPNQINLAIVPALMADKNGYRLGYGGGFYDRFLAEKPNIKTITVVFKELFIENLPHEEFDVIIDEIICI